MDIFYPLDQFQEQIPISVGCCHGCVNTPVYQVATATTASLDELCECHNVIEGIILRELVDDKLEHVSPVS